MSRTTISRLPVVGPVHLLIAGSLHVWWRTLRPIVQFVIAYRVLSFLLLGPISAYIFARLVEWSMGERRREP